MALKIACKKMENWKFFKENNNEDCDLHGSCAIDEEEGMRVE